MSDSEDDRSDSNSRSWADLLDFNTLIALPVVRERIGRHLLARRTPESADEYIRRWDKIFIPITHGLPVMRIATYASRLWEWLGVKTGATRSQRFEIPPGKILVAILCSLAENGHQIDQVLQYSDGCRLE